MGEHGWKIGDEGISSSCIAIVKFALDMPPLISVLTLSMGVLGSSLAGNWLGFWLECGVDAIVGSWASEMG